MKAPLFLSLLLASITPTLADHHHKVMDIGQNPESIVRGFDGDFFITIMNGSEKGDAVIKRMKPDGTLSIFAKGMNQPKGIAFVGDYLVCSDETLVWRIDKDGNTAVIADPSDFPEKIRFLNDVVAVPGENAIYITDMGDLSAMSDKQGNFWALDSAEAKNIETLGRLYKVTLDGKVTPVLGASPLMSHPNGVGIGKDGQILIGGFFTGNLLEQRKGKLHIVATGMRGADATEQDSKGNYYVSSWKQGKVWKIAAGTDQPKVILEGLQSAADFTLDEKAGRILCPDMKAGKLHIISLK